MGNSFFRALDNQVSRKEISNVFELVTLDYTLALHQFYTKFGLNLYLLVGMKIREWGLVWGRVDQREPGFGVGDGRHERNSFPSENSCAFPNSLLGSQPQN